MAARRPDERQEDPAPCPAREEDLVVHLVPMRRRHLRAVLRIEAQVYPRPWSLALFVSELALRSVRCYQVARVDGAVVGYAGLMLTGEDAHVTTIAVDPAWHRHKIATRLLLSLARVARSRGAAIFTLEVRVGNEAAQALYRQFGFQPVGIRRNYYTETNEDALIMSVENIGAHRYEERLAALDAAVGGTTIVDRPRW